MKELSFDNLESRLEELERELMSVNENAERLFRSEAELIELQMVLERAGRFFNEALHTGPSTATNEPLAQAPLLEASLPVIHLTLSILGFNHWSDFHLKFVVFNFAFVFASSRLTWVQLLKWLTFLLQET